RAVEVDDAALEDRLQPRAELADRLAGEARADGVGDHVAGDVLHRVRGELHADARGHDVPVAEDEDLQGQPRGGAVAGVAGGAQVGDQLVVRAGGELVLVESAERGQDRRVGCRTGDLTAKAGRRRRSGALKTRRGARADRLRVELLQQLRGVG